MTTILLVHGSCHGAWCWEKIIPRLAFYNTSDPRDAERAVARLTPQPMFPLVQPIAKARDPFPPKAFIECAQDQTISLDLQRFMHARFPMTGVATLDTDHSPFYSAPSELTKEIVAFTHAFAGAASDAHPAQRYAARA
jgi:hypothetical protein